MTSTRIISCVYTFGIIILTNVTADEYDDRLKSLLHTLTNQRAKYGLTFDHVDGGHRDVNPNQISGHTHIYPSVKEIKPIRAKNPKEVISNMEALNLLLGMKPVGRSHDEEINDVKESLRMCPKKPRVYNCNKGKCATEPPEEDLCDTNNKKINGNGYYYQKRYGRTDSEDGYIQSNEAAEFIRYLDKMLLEDATYEGGLGSKSGDEAGLTIRISVDV